MKTLLFMLLVVASATAQEKQIPPNYDESKVPKFDLPDPLIFEDGKTVDSAEDWNKRRSEILELFTDEVYGRAPAPTAIEWETTKNNPGFLDGKATLREVKIYVVGDKSGPSIDLVVITPNAVEKAPAFLGLNALGNHAIHHSPEISLPTSWMRERKGDIEAGRVKDNIAQEAGRGMRSEHWRVEKTIDAGIALATVYYGDIDPDFDDGFENGIHAHFGKPANAASWGSIATWAWGLSRAMDFLMTVDDIDSDRIAAIGHSRHGKTALWACANDERFALAISNNSGCGGAAISRRKFGERVSKINTTFPHWFCENFSAYNNNENNLPVDQHQLIALIAPRMVYIGSGEKDRWADPKGEFLAAKYANPVYQLLGKPGLGNETDTQPPLNHPVGETIRYHIRSGGHGVTDYDWVQYINALKSL